MSKFILFSSFNRKKIQANLEGRNWYRWVWRNHKFLNLLSIAAIISLGLCYLISVNQAASGGFQVTELEQRVAELQQANEKIELQISETLSMSAVKEASTDLDLVAVEDVDYLQDYVVALSD